MACYRLLVSTCLSCFLGLAPLLLHADDAKPAEKAWPYGMVVRPAVPDVQDQSWPRNPIDCFILARLEAKRLKPSVAAERMALLRRVTFDLTGLPPTLDEQQAFLSDDSLHAYEKVVDRLMASPRFGEHWAQYWLDLVRYAETDGFKSDDLRPQAYKYRDYVIKAFNSDLPYDRFVRQQLAGDELEPGSPDALVATGFNRLWPDENNAANLEQRRQEILDDVTDVAGQVFMGLTFGCARCHDHKFDPLLQTDYFRLQAFFAPMLPRDHAAPSSADQDKEVAWEEATRPIRQQMDELVSGKRAEMRKGALGKFRPEIQDAVRTPADKRTPYQQQIAWMAEQQIDRAETDAPKKLAEPMKKKYEELEKQMATMASLKPSGPASVMGIGDVSKAAPPTHLLDGGDWRKPGEELKPGFPLVLGEAPLDTELDPGVVSTGRRAALARWLTRPDHPLTARVMMNRLWQHHFGVGIVATPNDFGVQGTPPTHPELLDWLASEFVARGWSLKQMHRLMVTSAAYRQTSLVDKADATTLHAIEVDPQNQLLWHGRRRRLEGEAVRDAALQVAGDLNPRPYGPSAKPKLPALGRYSWKPDAKPEDQNRRSVYVLAKRNLRYPMFEVFDQPDLHLSCARRAQTTTAPQALLLFNGDFLMERAQNWAGALLERHGADDEALLNEAYQMAWGRMPSSDELNLSRRFWAEHAKRLEQTPEKNLALPPNLGPDMSKVHAAAVVDLCHAILNANEFLYVD